MQHHPTCSLVTSTYNWPEALELLLLSVTQQSVLPNEVIIADDGSTKVTQQLIEEFQSTFPVPLLHIWQEDKKNRKSTIMNKAIARSKCDYIIEIDGDIIMHNHFIKDHLSLAKTNQFLYGSRVNITKTHLPTLFKNKQTTFHFFSKGIKKRGRTIRIPVLAQLMRQETTRSSKLRGCNMSFWRADFIKINGYNEDFIGWGMEDSEMVQRLLNIGVKGKRLKYKGLAYHIYHKAQDKSRIPINETIEKNTTEKQVTRIDKGIHQYL